ncbi:MAG: TolC family protein [Tannerella sp.]|nr:TolC family protein [Tannerella sp.]
MMKKAVLLFLLMPLGWGVMPTATAQERLWTADDCMGYAVANSPAVRKQLYKNDTHQAEYKAAVASFFPSLTTSVSTQHNFGRAVDPETNTYVNTTTFNNYYEGYTSLPLFDGGQLVNQLRMAKVNRQAGMNDLQKAKDDLALVTLEAFVNVLYYRGTVRFAAEKREESHRLLYKVRREEELGLKGSADVALAEAQAAGDDYILANQQHLYHTAMLKLKEHMNYPSGETLEIDTAVAAPELLPHAGEPAQAIFESAQATNPTALQAGFKVDIARKQLLIRRGQLFPTVSLSAGVYTSYYKNLKSEVKPNAFGTQFANNRGEYVSLNFRFPMFNGLTRLKEVRTARNQMRIAREEQTEVLRQLQTAVEQSLADRDDYALESIRMEKKLHADELAYRLTLRKFEEGLMSPLDVQTCAGTLLESKATLLQKQLMYLLKCRQVDYYSGKPIIRTHNAR